MLIKINEDQDAIDRESIRRGRPKIVIERERLVFLQQCGFKIKDIATILGCSRCTVERRINEYNIPHRSDLYSSISDAELDEKVSSIIFSYVWTKVS